MMTPLGWRAQRMAMAGLLIFGCEPGCSNKDGQTTGPVHARGGDVGDLDPLLETAGGRRIGQLVLLRDLALSPEKLAEILAQPGFDEVTGLDVSGSAELGDRGLQQITKADEGALRTLQAREIGAGDDGAQALAAAPRLKLHELDLGGNALTSKGVTALANGPGLTTVEKLSLAGNPLGDAGVAALAAGTGLDALRELDLGLVGMTPAGLKGLMATPELASLEVLRISEPWSEEQYAALAADLASEGVGLGSLKRLVLGGMPVSKELRRAAMAARRGLQVVSE